MKIKNNKVIVLNEPKHLCCSVIYFSEKFLFPLSDQAAKNLDRLKEETDVFLVFSKTAQKKIKPKKLSNLFGAMAYTLGNSDCECEVINHSLMYSKEILSRNQGYCYISGSNLGRLKDEDFEAITNISHSQISMSVFKIHRIKYSDLAQIYVREKNNILFKLRTGLSWEDISGMYSTHTSHDTILFIKPKLIDFIYDFIGEEYKEQIPVNIGTYIESFDEYPYETFISSLLAKLENNTLLLNLNIRDAKS